MALTTNKKILLARFDRETVAGFLQTPGGFGPDSIEVLTPEGGLVRVPYSETKLVCFVRDFESGETWREHRAFSTRPKSTGLWVRFLFRDGDSIEGILANNLMQIEAAGFSIVPPDPSFQNQRLFIPKAALGEAQVLGVVGSPLRRRVPKKAGQDQDQLEMFP